MAMASGRSSEPETLRHRAALTFALASILPLLLFLYVVERHGLLQHTEVSLLLALSVAIAVLGFAYLMRTMKQIGALAEDFVRLEHGELESLDIRRAPHELAEMARIADTFNHVLVELKSNTQELENLILKLSTLSELTEIVSRIPNIKEILQIVLQRAVATLHAQAGSIMLVDEPTQTLNIAAVEGLDSAGRRQAPVRLGEGIAGQVARSGNPVLVEDVSQAEAPREVIDFKDQTSSFICMPLRARERIIGVLNLAKGLNQRAFSESDLKFLTTLLSHISFAVENARLLEEARQAAIELQQVVQEKSLQLDQAQQQVLQSMKLSALGQLIAGVAHELNNPLTTVLGYSQLLMGKIEDQKMRRELSNIFEGARLAAKIVQNLLAFARQEPAEKRLWNINDILSRALEMTAYDMHASNIQVETYLTPDLPPIMVDGNQLQQVFLNLITNARHAMLEQDQPRRLTLRTLRRGDLVRVECSDTGPGIAPEHLEHVFDPFFTTKEEGAGTGLGLSVSYGIVKAHGGHILVDTEAGKGATFVVEMPLDESITASTATRSPDAEISIEPTQGPAQQKVLVIDDEGAINDLVTSILTDEGYQVDAAHTAERGLHKLLEEEHALVLCDMRMPVMDGKQLYREVERAKPHLTARFIFMTGDVMSDATRTFLLETGNLYLTKPFTHEAFLDVVGQAWQRLSDTYELRTS
jgi:signal transduction histidine kinase/ActR/RegA family two-component response regulator